MSAPDKESIDAAVAKIKAIVAIPEVGEIYEGTVRSIMPYGCFVEIMPGKDGLLHISEIEWKRLETVEDAGIKEGDKIKVKLMEIDPKTGKYKLSHRVLEPKPEGYAERERRPRPERNNRQGGNGGNRENRQGGNGGNRENRQGGNNGGHQANNRQPRRNDYRDPLAEREPRDFNDSLDHQDFD